MLEATMQLLEQGEIEALTTNAVAARAGVSIGSLYQYFGNKQALLDALARRELAAMSESLVQAVNTVPEVPGDRIRGLVRAVLGSYGGRSLAHRRLIEHSLRQGNAERLSPLLARFQQVLVAEGTVPANAAPVKLSRAQAFVLTHALAGVLRALAASATPPPVRQVEDALVLLAVRYVDALREAG